MNEYDTPRDPLISYCPLLDPFPDLICGYGSAGLGHDVCTRSFVLSTIMRGLAGDELGKKANVGPQTVGFQ